MKKKKKKKKERKKEKGKLEKGAKVFVLHFWDFKLLAINCTLNP